jgi:hypothetical protein
MNNSGGKSMDSLDVQAFTYEHRYGLLPELTSAFTDSGGWITERETLSPTNMAFSVEIQLLAVLDLYAAILSTGVELTRTGHGALTELCTRRKHHHITADLGEIVSIRLEVAFLDDITLHSLLTAGSGLA